MLRTEPVALSRPGPSGAAGFHPRLSQIQIHACCILKGCAAFTVAEINSRHFKIQQGTGGNVAPNCVRFTTTQTGYIAPEGEQRYNMVIDGNYFEAEVSADAAGIIATLMIMNWLSWQVVDMGPEYATVLNHLIARQDALKDYVSIIQHPERELIWRAID